MEEKWTKYSGLEIRFTTWDYVWEDLGIGKSSLLTLIHGNDRL